MALIKLSLLAIGVSAGCGASSAQPETSGWDRVAKLTPGTRVEVIHGTLKRLQGIVVAASPEDITVQSGGTRQTVAKSDVARVSLFASSKKKRVLLGLVVGAGAGAAEPGAAAGGGVGALVGATTGGPSTIYRRP